MLLLSCLACSIFVLFFICFVLFFLHFVSFVTDGFLPQMSSTASTVDAVLVVASFAAGFAVAA
jgi:hypothetical protein